MLEGLELKCLVDLSQVNNGPTSLFKALLFKCIIIILMCQYVHMQKRCC